MTMAATNATPAPITARGRRTRDALLDAARTTFEQRGFSETRMSDVATAAGVSHGTVYTWFDSKESMLRALVDELVNELRGALRAHSDASPVERVSLANDAYLQAYRRNARLIDVAEQVAVTHEHFRRQLSNIRTLHVERVARDIRRLQEERIAAQDVDAHTAAAALCGMVEAFARNWFGRGETHDAQRAVDTLTVLWTRSLGIAVLQQSIAKEKST